jgi:hypothetical protein
MKTIVRTAVHAALGLAFAVGAPAFAASSAPTAPAARAAAASPEHIKAVEDLLGAMEAEKVLRGVAGRSRYASQAQRDAVFAKLDKVAPAEVYRRMAPALAKDISPDTAAEMTRFYKTPYGKKVIYGKYNSRGGIMMAGAREVVPPEEQKERKRAAYVQASQQLAAAQPAIEHEAFVLLQAINREKR